MSLPSAAPREPPAPERATRARAVLRILFIAGALFAFWNTLQQADLGKAGSLIASIGAPIALVFLPYLLAITLHAEAYRRMLAVLEHRPSYARLFSVVLSSEAVMLSFPGGIAVADSLNPYLLQRRANIPVLDGLTAVATKKSLIVFANALYIGVALALGYRDLQAASRHLIHSSMLAWFVLGSAIALLGGSLLTMRVLLSGSVAVRSHGALMRVPVAPLRRWLSEREAGFRRTDRLFTILLRERRAALASASTLLLGMWLAEGLETYVILRLLHVDLSYAQAIACEVVVVMLRSFAFMVPGALGILDKGYVLFFSAFGVPDAVTTGVAFVLIKRAKEIVFIAAGLLLFLLHHDAPTDARHPANHGQDAAA